MSLGGYMLLEFAVGFALFIVAALPFLYFAGRFASLMPNAAMPFAFGLAGLIWIISMAIGTHLLTEKLSKRWSK